MDRFGRIGVAAALAVGSTLVVTLGVAGVAQATSITVNTSADIGYNETTFNFPNDGLCSLRAAIISAESNSNARDVDCATGVAEGVDIITLSASLRGQTFNLSFDPANSGTGVEPFVNIGQGGPLEIVGDSTNAADFVIHGNGAVRPFSVGYLNLQRGSLRLANLTVRGGNGASNGFSVGGGGDGLGGAISMGYEFAQNGALLGSTLSLDNVVLRNNTASTRGGAVYGTAITITNNGGAYISNSAPAGGAVAVDEGPFVLNGYAVLFESNSATTTRGGAIYSNPANSTAFVHLERSLLLNNSANLAGGVLHVDGGNNGKVFELHDSTVSGNNSVFVAASNQQSFEYLRNTFVNNTQIFSTGGGFIGNSIIQGGACNDTGGPANITGSSNLIGGGATNCGSYGDVGDVTGLSATLAQNGGPEVQRTYALTVGSNAIDSGAQTYCGTVDARSVQRGIDGNGVLNNPAVGDCDIGAYEYVRYVVNFITGTTVVNEGSGTANIQVRLRILDGTTLASPLSVTVGLGSGSTARIGTGPLDDISIAGNQVTFPTGSADNAVANLVVNLNQDDVAELNGETAVVQLLSSTTPGVAIAEPRTSNIVIQDDDQAGVIITETGGNTLVSEATPLAQDTVQVRLQSRPDYEFGTDTPADVAMTITPDRDCEVLDGATVGTPSSPLQRSILNANWNTGFSLGVRAVDDLWDEDLRDENVAHTCELRFTFTSLDPVYANTQDALDVDVIDNDTAQVLVTPITPNLAVEGSFTAAMWNVRLNTPPDPGKPLPGVPRPPTTVTFDPDNQCNLGNGPGAPLSLNFSGSTWSFNQVLAATATQDLTVELLHQCLVNPTVTGGDPIYNNLSAPPGYPIYALAPQQIAIDVQDYDPPNSITDDPPFVDVTVGSLQVDEGTGAVDTFSVVLRRAPLTSAVFVSVDAVVDPSIAGPQLQVGQITQPRTSTTTLTFTPANWNVPQTVEVVAFDDDYDESDAGVPHPGQLTLSISSAARGFDDPALRRIVVDGNEITGSATLTANILDEDVSGLDVTWPATVVEGGPALATVLRLTSHPFNDVTVTFTTNGECTVNGVTTLSVPIVAANWNLGTPLSVQAVDDTELESAVHDCDIDVAVDSADAKYDVLDTSATVEVEDNEVAAVNVTQTGGSTSVTEGGATDTIDVVLGVQPASDVTVNLQPVNGQTNAPTATFTPANWDQPQTLTVSAIDDDVDETSPFNEGLALQVTSAAPGYSDSSVLFVDLAESMGVVVEVIDDDVAGVTVTPTTLSIDEDGGEDAYTVVLDSEPTANVTFTVSATGLCTYAPTTHTFTAANWDEPVEITVTAGNDDIAVDETCDVVNGAFTSVDGLYDAISAAGVAVTIVNDDDSGVLIGAPAGSVSEQGPTSTSFEVRLGSEPTADVAVQLTSSNQVTLNTVTLTFTDTNWNQPQTVTVDAVDDVALEGPHSATVSLDAVSGDPGYDASSASVTIDIVDNDTGTSLALAPAVPHNAGPTSVTAVVQGGATPTPTGAVTFTVDGAGQPPIALVGGAATLNLGTLSSGSHTVSVVYGGDLDYSGSGDSITFAVTARPVANDDSASLDEDSPATTIDVRANDTDADGDTLTIVSNTNAAHGTVTCSATACSYQPAADYFGADSFTYNVDDGAGLTDTATVTIDVAPIDDPPVAPTVATVIVPNGQAVTFELLNGATDVDGDVLEIVSYTQPAHGSVVCNTAGRCTYTPQAGYAGPDQFTYVVGDGQPQDSLDRFVQAGTVSAVLQLQVQQVPPTVPPAPPTPTAPPTTAAPGGRLPSTGSDGGSTLALAAIALAIGTGLLITTRRRATR